MADVDALLAELDDIEASCAAGEWDAAFLALHAHDQHVRSLLASAELAAGLSQVLYRQQAIERNIRRWRDDVAANLQRMQRGKQASSAYGLGSEPR